MNDVLDDLCGSQFWNSSLTWHTDDPYFTSCFERTVLAWIPSLFLAIFSICDITRAAKSKTVNIPWSFLSITKMIVCTIIIATELAECGVLLRTNLDDIRTVFLFTPALRILSTIFCMILMFYHRLKGIRTSGVLFVFWLLQTVFGVIQLRTELKTFIEGSETHVSSALNLILYICFAAMLLLNFFADLSPMTSNFSNLRNPWPEKSSSFPSRLSFSWYTGLAVLGFKRPLSIEDLWDLSPKDSSRSLTPKFDQFWARVTKTGPTKKGSILRVLSLMFGPACFVAALQKLGQDLLAFVSPLMLKLLIDYVQGNEPQWRGFLYALVILISSTVQTLLSAQHFIRMTRIGLQIKTTLISAVYIKALKLSNAARQEVSTGEVVNLVAIDAQTFVEIMPYLNTLWSAPLQIILALFFLWQLLGWSVLAGVTVMIMMIPVNGFLAKQITKIQIKQLKNKDERSKIMNDILSGIKALKLNAWETSFEKMILSIRGKEVKEFKKTAYLNACSYFIWSSTSFLVTASTFICYALSSSENVLNASKAFVAISLFNLMFFPMSLLPMVIVAVAESRVSIKRLNKFLNSDELNIDAVDRSGKQEYSAIIENGTFEWTSNGTHILKNINLQIKPKTLVAILGATGSGKSSLISAFLGEMEKSSGLVGLKGSVAYAPQTAWVQNASLRDNILFGNPFNENHYRRVLHACALETDLEALPQGDQSEIGDKGMTLSGGQKQRISLARAVYHDADVYFLDDPLSSVDSHVAKHIFDEVIGPKGILRDKTRIFVTHAVNHLKEVDLIVVLQDGSISEIGTYNELRNSKFVQQENSSNKRNNQEIRTGDSNESVIRVDESESDEMSPKKEQDKQSDEENIQTGSVKWAVYHHYLKSVNPWIVVVALAMSTLYQGFSIGSNYWLSLWSTDETLVVNGTQNTSKRDMYVGVYGALGLAQITSTIFVSLTIQLGALKAAFALHNALIRAILRAKLSFFDLTPFGRIMNRFSADVDQLDNALPATLRGWMGCLFAVMGTVFVICFTTPIFILVFIPIAIIYYFIQRFYVATSRQLKRLEANTRSPIYSHILESMNGSSVVRAYNVQQRFMNESKQKVDSNQKCSYPEAIADRWLSVRLETLGNFIVFFSSLLAVMGRDTVTAGLVGLSISYALQITDVLNWLVRITAELKTNIVAVERVKEYTDVEQEASWDSESRVTLNTWPDHGKIEFKNFGFRYREGLNLALKNLNLTIKCGEKVGIVGRTGAGKSSLTLALSRLVEPSVGQILIDDIDITQLRLDELRSKLTIIPQDPTLFSGSLRINLDPFEKHTDDEVWRSIEQAHLKSFVSNLPNQLQYEVTNGGENLSLGQKQLVCLARALLRKTKVLVLDEATAAIDLETDDIVQKTIRNEFATCTVLTIAHRLNTVIECDRVFVLDDGEVKEFDSPSTLMKKEDSIFFGLAKDAGIL